MEEGSAKSSPRRRLPTKASSGLISLPPSAPRGISGCEGVEDSNTSQPSTSPNCSSPRRPSASPGERWQLGPAELDAEINSIARAECAKTQEGPNPSTTSYGPPRMAPKPPPLKTGPLNQASTPQAQALPVKRRGSYQSLKRHPSALKAGDGEGPSVIGLIKKATHWERFGTILVLGCLWKGTADGGDILQMLQAEGYDTDVAETQAQAVAAFSARDVFPDVVLVDSDHSFNTKFLIRELQAKNPTVAIICLGSRGGTVDAVSALQAGAADFLYRPIDLDEMVARIERHVQRQHCIKLELETAMEDAKAMMAQLGTATMLGDMMFNRGAPAQGGNGRLIAVAETDFEQQITELSEENHKLDSKLQELVHTLKDKDHENERLAKKLIQLEVRMTDDSSGVQGQLSMVAEQNHTLMSKVDALEKLVRHSQEFPTLS